MKSFSKAGIKADALSVIILATMKKKSHLIFYKKNFYRAFSDHLVSLRVWMDERYDRKGENVFFYKFSSPCVTREGS